MLLAFLLEYPPHLHMQPRFGKKSGNSSLENQYFDDFLESADGNVNEVNPQEKCQMHNVYYLLKT